MEHILNLLTLTKEERAAFGQAAQGHEQRFIPDGRKEDGSPVTDEDCRWAAAILGNPPRRRCLAVRPCGGSKTKRRVRTSTNAPVCCPKGRG